MLFWTGLSMESLKTGHLAQGWRECHRPDKQDQLTALGSFSTISIQFVDSLEWLQLASG
jgi:hypothetical protein